MKYIVPIIRGVPDAKYLIMNDANSSILGDDDIGLFRKVEIVMDTSGRTFVNLPELFKKCGKDMFCFSTQYPILDYRTGLLSIESWREDGVRGKTKEVLRYENAGKT